MHKAHPDPGQHSIRDGQTFTAERTTLRAVFTPGHSQDHMCFVLEDSGAMFTGDNVLGHGGSVVVEDLGQYMKSLKVMTQSVGNEDIAVGYPGHGAVIDDLPAKLIIWSRHWEMREKKVLSAFKGNTKRRASLTLREIIVCLYGPEMEAMAGPFITQVLSKLADEGKVGFAVAGQEKKWFML